MGLSEKSKIAILIPANEPNSFKKQAYTPHFATNLLNAIGLAPHLPVFLDSYFPDFFP